MAAAGEQPSSLMSDVLRRIDQDADRLVGLVSELVRIPSLPGEEQEIAAFMFERARELGFAPELLELRDTDVPAPGRPGIACVVQGKGDGYELMFNGHLDTEPVSPAYAGSGEDPFSGRVEDGKIFGIGTMNMKAGVAAYFYGVKALLEAGFEPLGDIVLTAVPAELNGGAGTRYFLESGLVPDLAINAEATELTLAIASAGVTNVRVTLLGKPTHMAFADKGKSVVSHLQTLLAAVPELEITYDRARYDGLLEPRVNVGYVHGGYEYRAGLFMDRCEVILNVRAPRGVTPRTLRADLASFQELLLAREPAMSIQISVLNPVPRFMPAYHVSRDDYIVEAVGRAHRQVTGAEPEFTASLAGWDAGNLQHWWNVPTIVYGPAGSSGSFTPPETVGVDEVITAAKVYALAALDVGQRRRGELDGRMNVPL